MDLEDDPLAWAAAHLPTMTDAEANQAVGRLIAAGAAPFTLLAFLSPIGTALAPARPRRPTIQQSGWRR